MRAFVSAGLALATGSADLGPLPEWNLADLYPGMDSPAFAADLAAIGPDAAAFAAEFKSRLASLARDGGLLDAIVRYEALDDKLGRIMSYAGLIYADDTSDPIRAKFHADALDKVTAASSDLLFFQLELNRIDDDTLAQAMKGEVARYRPWLEDIRKDKPHQLEDRLEQLFLEKQTTSAAAWNRLFDETMTALRFKVGGEELSLEPVLSLMQDPDAGRRQEAATALADGLKANIRTFTLITNTLAKDKEVYDRWHGFGDVAASRHLANRVEGPVVDALVEAVRAAYPRLSHRYYALKARWFGVETLPHWDRNAPLPKVAMPTVPWDRAQQTVLEAYNSFSPRMASIARTFFDRRWIDAPVRPGKAPGAFSHPTVPSAHPYVLLNYQGKPRDVMVLAHELGHGVHQVLAAPNGALMAPTPLTLAETASVFGEMLTFRALLDETRSVEERRSLLAAKVEDMINTVVRQIAFYTFERKLHLARREGELTADEIGALWLSVQAESLGPAIRLMPGYEVYWAYIPHFIHSPFYVYAYAFGDCLVNSLYGVFERARDGFAERYLAMLEAGGTKHHSELLAPFGLDASDPGFWQIGLGMIERLIDELEALPAPAIR
jgi:oligoendopeptidase F